MIIYFLIQTLHVLKTLVSQMYIITRKYNFYTVYIMLVSFYFTSDVVSKLDIQLNFNNISKYLIHFKDIFNLKDCHNSFKDIPEDLSHLVYRLPEVILYSKSENTYKLYNSYIQSLVSVLLSTRICSSTR